MATLGAVSDRIKAKQLAHQKKADEWAAELDAMDRQEPELFDAGDALVAARQADMAELRANVAGIKSNFPSSGDSAKQPADESKASPQAPPALEVPADPSSKS